MKPTVRPKRPYFSCGPCAKYPGWSLAALEAFLAGRSHRSKESKARLSEVVQKSRDLLGIPKDYRLGILPASDTGAVETAMWSLLGARGVDVLAWESFSGDWATDVTEQLKLENARIFIADYGQIPDLSAVNFDHDVVFPWNGTTSGACLPNGDWIPADRKGLTICDATSAAFAMELPWDKLDVTTYSWQKVLGGEAQHGVIVLSPRAVERLESYTPSWPIPKIFQLTENSKLNEKIFEGVTINTPSMLCVEDVLASLRWVESIGGRKGLQERVKKNYLALSQWIDQSSWIENLVSDPKIRSTTSVCVKISDPWFKTLPKDEQKSIVTYIMDTLAKEDVAHDINSYGKAPLGLRFWIGATVDVEDIHALTQWLDWAYGQVKQQRNAA